MVYDKEMSESILRFRKAEAKLGKKIVIANSNLISPKL